MIKVLYIAGPGRSGSTVLGDLLGQASGLFHVGEATSLWQMGLDRAAPCGCGEPLGSCPVWKPILQHTFGDTENIDLQPIIDARSQAPRSYQVPFLTLRNESTNKRNYEPYLKILSRLYHSIACVTKCEWIIDSSKIPSRAYLLTQIDGVEVYILHLIRDPRAVLYSWKRKAIEGFRVKPTQNLIGWNSRNIVVEFLCYKYGLNKLCLRYEDFASAPESSIQQILQFIGTSNKNLEFISDSQAYLDTTHTVWGNPKRSKRGNIRIQVDNEWKSHLSLRLNAYAILASWPLMLRYHYL
jgi:hypothetical protein